MPQLEEISSNEEQPTTEEVSSMSRAETGSFGRYLLAVMIFSLLLYCAPFYLVRRADFDRLSSSLYSLPLNYAYKTAGQNADVVLFGDSTVLHGIDPRQMSMALGLKVLNLPNTASTLRVMDDLPLRRYLKSNRPPKLIVFYFAPWDCNYAHTPLPIGTYEGQEVLAHQGSAKEIFTYVRSHLLESLQFPFQFYLANAPLWQMFNRPDLSAGVEVVETQGHQTNPMTRLLDPHCEFPSAAVNDLRFDSVRLLGATYRTPQTSVLYFLAPVPSCLNASAVVDRSYNDLPAAPPKELPFSMFRGGLLYLHPTAAAVPAVTQNLIDAVKPALSGSQP